MKTTIHGNGSKWHGEAPDPIEKLFEVLAEHALTRSLHPHAANVGEGRVEFYGNFEAVSHAFRITTDDPALCARLFAAIRENHGRADYKSQPSPKAGRKPC